MKEFRLFKSLISQNDIGEKKNGDFKRLNSKDRIGKAITNRKNGSGNKLLRYITNSDLAAHMAGQRILYFSGNDRIEAGHNYTLLMIDIDNHNGVGLKSEGIRLAQDLKSIFPSLYFEDSTNGNGTHGYIIVDRFTFSGPDVRDICRTLETALQIFAKSYNIQKIEIKGNPGWTTWNNGKCEYHCGTMAKIPYGLDTDDFHNTTKTTITDLRDWAEKYIELNSNPLEVVRIKSDNIKFGSNTIVSRDLQESIRHNGSVNKLAYKLLPAVDWSKKANRTIISAEVIAEAILVLHICTKNMCKDGSLPQERVRKIWNYLNDAQILSTRFDTSKFAAIRNMLSKMGLIKWTNHNYTISMIEDVKGQACKWCLSAKLVSFIEGNSSMNSVFSPVVYINSTCGEQENSKYLRPTLLEILTPEKAIQRREIFIPPDELWDIMSMAA